MLATAAVAPDRQIDARSNNHKCLPEGKNGDGCRLNTDVHEIRGAEKRRSHNGQGDTQDNQTD